MRYFCTYSDRGYAARLLCLHDSLLAQGEPFQLRVLCLDAELEAVIAAAGRPALVPVPLAELLAAAPDYAAVRSGRSPVEFIFTTTPVFVRHCLGCEPAAELMTYLDADLFFFGPASAVFREQGDASVGIVPHRFPDRLAERRQYGTYNVAWVSFRRDAAGLAALEWWRARCLEWCGDRPDQGRFADQGYLNEFPGRFPNVAVLDHPGINAAPWNLDGVGVAARDGAVTLNGRPLLFFHFQGVREMAPGWFDPGLRAYGTPLTRELREWVYRPYLRRLAARQAELQAKHGVVSGFCHQRQVSGGTWPERWEEFKRRWVHPAYRRLRGQWLHCPPA